MRLKRLKKLVNLAEFAKLFIRGFETGKSFRKDSLLKRLCFEIQRDLVEDSSLQRESLKRTFLKKESFCFSNSGNPKLNHVLCGSSVIDS